MCVCSSTSGCSDISCWQTSSIASVVEYAKRGVTAYNRRPRLWYRSISIALSSCARSGVTCSSGRSRRSESTSPMRCAGPTRRPPRRAPPSRRRNARRTRAPSSCRARRARAETAPPSPRHTPRSAILRLFRQRDRLEPVEQRSPHRADDAHLREVHVRVDESRKDEAAAPVDRVERLDSRRECRRSRRRRPRGPRRRAVRRPDDRRARADR